METKKQIGWKFKTKDFKKAASLILNCSSFLNGTHDFSIDSINSEKLKELNILEVWCDAVYEEYVFKEHDWVYIESSDLGWVKRGDVVQLGGKYWDSYGVKQEDTKQHISCITEEYPEGNSGLGYISFREATSEEIEEANKIKIGGHLVGFYPTGVLIDDNHYSKSEMENILAVLNIPTIQSINVRCNGQIVFKKNVIQKILNKM